jgi:protein O-mannosyl-transferase
MSKKNTPKQVDTPPQYFTVSVTAETPKSRFFKENKLTLLIITLFSIGLYIQTLTYDYVLDDTMVIVKNEFTKQGISGIPDIFRYESFRGYFGAKKQLLEGDRYRPLSIATFAVEQSLLGGNKAISHFINVLLYVFTGILLFRVLLFMFENARSSDKLSVLQTIPFMATLLFIVHPLHTEVVANIKGRDEILALLGELGTLYFMFKYVHNSKYIYLYAQFVVFLMGVLSKESALMFLAIVPLTAHFFTKATNAEKLKVTLPVLAGTIIYLILRTQAIGYLIDNKEISDVMNNPFYGMTWGEKTATIFYTFLIYLKLLIFPHPLTYDYYPYQIPKVTWSAWQSILALFLHLGLVAVILRGWKNKTIWAYCAALYLITFSIVSNLVVSVGTFMNERFLYHASLGFCIALAYFLHNNFKITHHPSSISHQNTEGGKKLGISIFILMIIGFSIKTLMRVPDWRNVQTLNKSAIRYSPNSARANCFYAVSLWENTYTKLPKDVSETRRRAVLDSLKFYFDKSVSILPSYGTAHGMRAAVAAEYFKLDGNYDALLKVFEEANLVGTYHKFIVDYLGFLNQKVSTPTDKEKLLSFYRNMLNYYEKGHSNTGMPDQYQQFIDTIEEKK